jgi:hypothetical protein
MKQEKQGYRMINEFLPPALLRHDHYDPPFDLRNDAMIRREYSVNPNMPQHTVTDTTLYASNWSALTNATLPPIQGSSCDNRRQDFLQPEKNEPMQLSAHTDTLQGRHQKVDANTNMKTVYPIAPLHQTKVRTSPRSKTAAAMPCFGEESSNEMRQKQYSPSKQGKSDPNERNEESGISQYSLVANAGFLQTTSNTLPFGETASNRSNYHNKTEIMLQTTASLDVSSVHTLVGLTDDDEQESVNSTLMNIRADPWTRNDSSLYIHDTSQIRDNSDLDLQTGRKKRARENNIVIDIHTHRRPASSISLDNVLPSSNPLTIVRESDTKELQDRDVYNASTTMESLSSSASSQTQTDEKGRKRKI